MVTCRNLPTPAEDDVLLQEALRARGVVSVLAAWDDPAIAWHEFGAVVIRSTWDYHLRIEEFSAWIARLELRGTRLWNPPRILRWNAHKGYLRDLAASGIPIVPTHWVAKGSRVDLRTILDQLGCARAVVKPAVAASAHAIRRVDRSDIKDQQAALDRLLAHDDVLVQPYLSQIAHGEYSLVFIDSRYSHTVRKRPAPGDFRVQPQFGGCEDVIVPPKEWITQAQAVLTAAALDSLFARVDVVEEGQRLLVMEVEFIEPVLFLAAVPAAPGRLADAIIKRLDR